MKAILKGIALLCVIVMALQIFAVPVWAENTTDAPEIVTQPTSYAGAIGSTAAFTVEATGEGLRYQWYYSNNGGRNWSVSTLEGNDTTTVLVQVKTFRDGQQYQCVITDANGKTVNTEVVTVTVQRVALAIITEPEDYTGAVGTTATFRVEAVGEGLTYQWYYSNNDGKTWSLSTMAGATTSKVSVVYKAFRAGQQYKCMVSDNLGNTVESAVAILGGKKAEANVEISDARIKRVSNGTIVDGEGVKVDSTTNPSDLYYPAAVSADKLSATFDNVSMTLPGAWAEFSVTMINNGTADANLSDCILETTGMDGVITINMPDLTGVVLTPGDSCTVTFVAQVPVDYSAPTLDVQGAISVRLIFT